MIAFDRQPTLEGVLVKLRPLRPSDRDDLYAVAADPLLWEQHPARNRHERAVFDAFFDDAIASGGALAVLDARDSRIVGTSRFHGHDVVASEVEIGWTFLARSCWGGAVNGELKRLMLAHAFRTVRTVVFLVAPGNVRSQRALAKLGAVPLARRIDDERGERLVFAMRAPA